MSLGEDAYYEIICNIDAEIQRELDEIREFDFENGIWTNANKDKVNLFEINNNYFNNIIKYVISNKLIDPNIVNKVINERNKRIENDRNTI
ncbi:TPA: hypothetical protein ACYKJT_001692 [Campylobacter coli]